MKRPPEDRAGRKPRPVRELLALGSLLLASTAGGQVPAPLSDDWYHVELLVFAREDAGSLGAERWEPLPALSYPEEYRYLIDPERADRRVAESLAFVSLIDDRGIQRITIPAPVALLETAERPDAQIDEPYEAPDPNMPAPLTGGETAPAAGAGSGMAGADESLPGGEEEGEEGDEQGEEAEAAPTKLLALPEQLLPDADLAFGGQARTLRRRGERVLFHGHWWSRLPEGAGTLPLVLDRAADIDAAGWPALQGSVHIYRSRFLHIDVDLWLNTMASYLPAGWQIEAPPLATPSLLSATLAGDSLDPWAPPLPPAPRAGADTTEPVPASSAPTGPWPPGPDDAGTPVPAETNVSEEEMLAAAYPWRHAITHRQSRRMRSGETHYLDHPVIGVIVRLRPAGPELLPFAGDDEAAFRERHGLPEEYLTLPDAGEG